MGDNFMRLLYYSPDEKLEVCKIHKDLKSISNLMKTNFFDTVMYNNMLLIYDPKGILKYSNYKEINGLKIRGPFIFTGNDTLEKDFKSLDINQIRFLQNLLEDKEKEVEELEL